MPQNIIGGLTSATGIPSGNTGGRRESDDLGLKKACSDFEAIFIYQMLATMRKTIPEGGGACSTGLSNSPYATLFDQKLAEALAGKEGGIGIARMLYEQLKMPDQ